MTTSKGITLEIEQSERTGDWWVRARAGNHRIVGTSQEGYVHRSHATTMLQNLRIGGTYRPVVTATNNGQWRWHLVASNGRKVFGSHEALTSRTWAQAMAVRVAAGEQ